MVEDEDTQQYPWPTQVAPTFASGGSRRLNAVVQSDQTGWEAMYRYAEGYRRAAAAVFSAHMSTRQPAEFALGPLAFLWRHHLELALKWIIAKGRQLHGEEALFPNHHRLDELWKAAPQYLVEIGSVDAPELVVVDAVFAEFHQVDPGADGFRYPFARGSRATSLPNAPREINLEILHETMLEVAYYLECGRDLLSVAMDAQSDQLNESE